MPLDTCTQFLPRLLRLRDAPDYLGMDRNRFNKEVRPNLIEIPIGSQGIAFDRLDLDSWVDEYKSRNGRLNFNPQGEEIWDVKKRQGSIVGRASGISTKRSEAADFAKALAQVTSKKPKHTS